MFFVFLQADLTKEREITKEQGEKLAKVLVLIFLHVFCIFSVLLNQKCFVDLDQAKLSMLVLDFQNRL